MDLSNILALLNSGVLNTNNNTQNNANSKLFESILPMLNSNGSNKTLSQILSLLGGFNNQNQTNKEQNQEQKFDPKQNFLNMFLNRNSSQKSEEANEDFLKDYTRLE